MSTYPTPVLLPGKSCGRRSLVGCSQWGPEESDTTERLHFHFLLSCIGEGNGNPVQCSCLEDPRDGGAWWAAFSEVTQSRTRLKWLSNKNPFMLKCKCLQLEIVRSSHKDYPFRPLFAWKVRFRLWLRLKKNNMCHMKLFWHDNTWNN